MMFLKHLQNVGFVHQEEKNMPNSLEATETVEGNPKKIALKVHLGVGGVMRNLGSAKVRPMEVADFASSTDFIGLL
jgi:hypothetical protein